MEKITKKKFVDYLINKENCLIGLKFSNDEINIYNILLDFDEKFSQENFKPRNINDYEFKKCEKVGSTFLKFSNGSRLDFNQITLSREFYEYKGINHYILQVEFYENGTYNYLIYMIK